MAQTRRLERLRLAALRLREIQNEAAAIYRSFPELDRRPKIIRHVTRSKPFDERSTAIWSARLH
jgi:hypothetical protein